MLAWAVSTLNVFNHCWSARYWLKANSTVVYKSLTGRYLIRRLKASKLYEMLQIKQWTSNDMLMVLSLRNQTMINHHQVRGSYTNSIHGLLGLPSSPWIPTPGALPDHTFFNTNIRHIGIFGLDKLCLCQRFGHVTQMQRGLEIQLRHPDGSHCKRRGLSIQELEEIQIIVDTIDDTSCCSYTYDDMSSKKQEVEMFGPSENLILQWQVACEWTTHVSNSICLRTPEQM